MAEDLSKRLYVENVESWIKQLSKKRFLDMKLDVKVIERGIILPARRLKDNKGWEGGVCDKDFKFIAGFKRGDGIRPINPHLSVISSYTVDRKEIVKLDENVIFGGVLLGHFGHFMMECWNRLWYVLQHPELKLKILFITSAHGGYHLYFDEFFRLMGLEKERIVYVQKPTQCRFIMIPEQAQYSFVNFTKEYLFPYQAIKSGVTPGKSKKLYLTRTENNDSDNKKKWDAQYFNEKYFEDFFTARGFESVQMNRLSIKEQISLVMGADEIAAVTGTLTNWAIFCKPSTKFIMLNRIHRMTVHFQGLVNEAVNLTNAYFVDVSKNFMFAKHANSVCMLGSNEYWKAFVADYFGEQIEEDDDSPYFEEALDKYVNFWCQKYADPKSENFDKIVDSFKNMCDRIITLERETKNNRPLLTYQTHVAKKGWGVWKSENQLSNPVEQKLDVQAIKIEFSKPFYDVYYSVYHNDNEGWYLAYHNGNSEGWSEEVSTAKMAGTTGKSKPIMGIKIRLDEAGAEEFNIFYRVHKFDGEWTAWAKNGQALYSYGQKINAIQIKLDPVALDNKK